MSDLLALSGTVERTIKLVPYAPRPDRSDFKSDTKYRQALQAHFARKPKEYVLRSPTMLGLELAESNFQINLLFGLDMSKEVFNEEGDRIPVFASPTRVTYAWLWVMGVTENPTWEEDFPSLGALLASVPAVRAPGYDGATALDVATIVGFLRDPMSQDPEADTIAEGVEEDDDSESPFCGEAEAGADAGGDLPGVSLDT